MTRFICLFLLLLAPALASHDAHAYCAEQPGSYSLNRFVVGGTRHGQPIPVYVVTSGVNSVVADPAKVNFPDALGLSKSQVIEAVQEVARNLSETGANLRFQYAGELTSLTWREGVVIHTPDGSCGGWEDDWCSGGKCGSLVALCAGVPYVIDPYSDDVPTGTLSVHGGLLHEMTHSLGLNHLHQYCDPGNFTNDPNHCSEPGCSSRHFGALNNWREFSTVDDILGFKFGFGTQARQVYGYSSPTGDAGTWTTLAFPNPIFTNVPMALSGADNSFLGGASALVTTDANDRLQISIDYGSGYQAPIPVGASGLGPLTYHRPAVAVGNGDVLVAWIHDEVDDLVPEIRMARYDISSDSWAPTVEMTDVEGYFQTIGLGYDSTNSVFLLSSRYQGNAMGLVSVVDGLSSTALGIDYLIGSLWNPVPLRQLGKTGCHYDSSLGDERCYTAAAARTDGLYLVRGDISFPDYVYRGVIYYDTKNSYGLTDSVVSPSGAILTARAISTHNVWIEKYDSYGGASAPVLSPATYDWPSAVGLRTTWYRCGFYFCSSRQYHVVTAD